MTPRPATAPTGEFPAGAQVACATCHTPPFFTDNKAHRHAVVAGDPILDPGEVGPDGKIRGFHTPSLLGARLSAPYFHDGSMGDPTAPDNSSRAAWACGHSTPSSVLSARPPHARALIDNVLPFYSGPRFNFGFTDEEIQDLAEYILSL